MIPAKRSRFFVHCRGRSAASAARATVRRGANSRTGAASGRVTRRMVERRSLVLSAFRRQHQLEAAAATRLGVELDPAAERNRELARDRKAETRPGVVA